jgi:hypothetical protein
MNRSLCKKVGLIIDRLNPKAQIRISNSQIPNKSKTRMIETSKRRLQVNIRKLGSVSDFALWSLLRISDLSYRSPSSATEGRDKLNSESAPAERVASGSALEGGPRMKAFSEVTGGRAPSFHDLSVGEAPAPSLGEGNGGGGQVSLADKS